MTVSDTIERVARALAPLAWRALGLCDTLAQENRRKASLRHAEQALTALRPGDELPNGLVVVPNEPKDWRPGEPYGVDHTITKLRRNGFQYASAGDAKRLVDEVDRLRHKLNKAFDDYCSRPETEKEADGE